MRPPFGPGDMTRVSGGGTDEEAEAESRCREEELEIMAMREDGVQERAGVFIEDA